MKDDREDIFMVLSGPVAAPISSDRMMYADGTINYGLRWFSVKGQVGMTLQVWSGNHWIDIPAVYENPA